MTFSTLIPSLAAACGLSFVAMDASLSTATDSALRLALASENSRGIENVTPRLAPVKINDIEPEMDRASANEAVLTFNEPPINTRTPDGIISASDQPTVPSDDNGRFQSVQASANAQSGAGAENSPSEGQTETVLKPVFEDVSDADVYAKTLNYMADLDTMVARFRQTSPTGEVALGDLFLDRPGKLRFSYDEPNPQLIIAKGGKIYVYDKELETTLEYEVNKTPMRFLLQKKLDTDDVVMKHIERTFNSVAVTLASTDENLEGELVLVFSAPELELARWAVIDARQGVTVVDLTETKTGTKIKSKIFDISGFAN